MCNICDKMLPKKLGMERKDDFNIDDPPVWKCLLKGGVKGVYARLVNYSDRLKCLHKWSKELSTEVNIKEVFVFLRRHMIHVSADSNINCYTDFSPQVIFSI